MNLDESRIGYASLERACELACDIDIHVVGRIDKGHATVQHRRQLRDLVQEATALLPDDVSLSSEIRAGDLGYVAMAVGTELRPAVIVLGVSHVRGSSVVAIADALSVPVLLARTPAPSRRVVAASDVRSEFIPVVGVTRRILGAREDSITVFHAAVGSPIGECYFDRSKSARLVALGELAIAFGDVRVVVEEARDPVEAIVQLAGETDTDVLAIGYRQRPSFGSTPSHTTQQVIDRCDCSVLVVPIARDLETA